MTGRRVALTFRSLRRSRSGGGKVASPAETLNAAIARSGRSTREFAHRILGRGERQVRRWLEGDRIPAETLRWLESYALGDVEVTWRNEVPPS